MEHISPALVAVYDQRLASTLEALREQARKVTDVHGTGLKAHTTLTAQLVEEAMQAPAECLFGLANLLAVFLVEEQAKAATS